MIELQQHQLVNPNHWLNTVEKMKIFASVLCEKSLN